jgi:hypothetical protein
MVLKRRPYLYEGFLVTPYYLLVVNIERIPAASHFNKSIGILCDLLYSVDLAIDTIFLQSFDRIKSGWSHGGGSERV